MRVYFDSAAFAKRYTDETGTAQVALHPQIRITLIYVFEMSRAA